MIGTQRRHSKGARAARDLSARNEGVRAAGTDDVTPRWLERLDPAEFGVVRLAPSVRLASEVTGRASAQRAASMAHHPAGRARRRSVA